MRLVKHNYLLSIIYGFLKLYPAPVNLTYLWNFGVYALVCLVIQIITGIALAMHYTPDVALAFHSVEHIMRDVNNGWLLRYIHANGASMFFIVVYVHTFRNIYYTSYNYPRQLLWSVGVIILFLMIVTAFFGYVLPWGQMSFWGATVITNLFTAIPQIGDEIVTTLWGGYSISNATLVRFFSLHFVLPFVITALVIIHVMLLHYSGSNNPLGIYFSVDKRTFFYYVVKDVNGIIFFFMFFSLFVFFAPNLLGHPDNYVPANPLVTPPHIVPEWYLLLFYAILRSIPDKLLGVAGLAAAIAVLLVLPLWSNPEIRSMDFRPLARYSFYGLMLASIFLTYVGGQPVGFPYLQLGQAAGLYYFAFFVVILPSIERIERFFWSNEMYLAKKGILLPAFR